MFWNHLLFEVKSQGKRWDDKKEKQKPILHIKSFIVSPENQMKVSDNPLLVVKIFSKPFFSSFLNFHLQLLYVRDGRRGGEIAYRGQRTTFGSQFSPSTVVWAPGIQLRIMWPLLLPTRLSCWPYFQSLIWNRTLFSTVSEWATIGGSGRYWVMVKRNSDWQHGCNFPDSK